MTHPDPQPDDGGATKEEFTEKNLAAFPMQASDVAGSYDADPGITVQQYAAIKLRVPNSGCGWLDEMITESLRNEFAAAALTGLMTEPTWTISADDVHDELTDFPLGKYAYQCADSLLKARQA